MNIEAKLSRTQYALYIECVMHPERTTYNIPLITKIPEEYSDEVIESTLQTLISVHPILSTKIVVKDNGDVCLQSGNPVNIPRKVCEKVPTDAELVRPFALDKDMLTRFEIIDTAEGRFLFMDIHHIIIDGMSVEVFGSDFGKILAGENPSTEKMTFADIANREEQLRKTDTYRDAHEFYSKLLDGYEPDCAPAIDSEQKDEEQGWLSIDFDLDEDKLRALKHENGISKSAFFTSALGFITARFNCSGQSLISTVYSDRADPDTANTIDMMVKTMPFVTDIEKFQNVHDLLTEAQKNLSISRKNTVCSFVDLSEEFGLNNDINFAYQGSITDLSLDFPEGFEIRRIYDSRHIEETKLLLEVGSTKPGSYNLHIGYRKDSYSREFALSFGNSFIQAAKGFMNCEKLSEISLVDDDAMKLLDSFNDTYADYDKVNTIPERFRRMAKLYPDNTAVVFKDKKISYKELDEMTDALAVYLRKQGIGPEKLAAVLIPRSEYMVTVSLAVLKTGGAYMPLDPSYPPERLNLMVQDSQALVLVESASLSHIITDEFKGQRLLLDEVDRIFAAPVSEAEKSELLAHTPDPKDLFILLYTSGSTGTPKGVELVHSNLMAFCSYYAKTAAIDHNSRITAYASYGFDADMMDLYPTITSGAAVYIIDEDLRLDLVSLHRYFGENKITHAFMTTQIGRQFACMENPGSLQLLSTGGEKLVSMDPPSYRFWNAYGPTECTVFTTYMPVDRRYADIPIGKPLDNLKLYIVDKNGNRLPVGAAGELWISGPQVSRGYLRRPEKTAEVYIDNPFECDAEHSRIYRSGDIVRYLPDGCIQFIGRRDAQVKVRGFRIELTEVEEVIRRFSQVKDVTVAAYDDPAGGKYLAAYVVSDETVDVEAMNEFIRAEKPPYMVPAVTMQIEAIPYNQNQKVNKRVLPVPQRKAKSIVPPENDMQQKIFDSIAEIVGHREFGIDTDLDMVGLTSIGVVQLNISLAKAFDVSIKISDFKQNDTVRKLESFILKTKNSEEAQCFEMLADYPLTKTQQGIFAECMAHPDSTIYNIPMLLRFEEKVDVDRLKKAIVKAVLAHSSILTKIFVSDSGEIRCRRDESVSFDESMISVLSGDADKLKKSLVKPYDILKDQLFHVAIIEGGSTYLYFDMHHIISDGTSLNIMLSDISAAYEGNEPEKEKYTAFEISLTEEKALAGDAYPQAKAFYEKLLEGADTDCMPPKTVKSDNASGAGMLVVQAEKSAALLKEFCKKQGISMSALMNAAFGIALGRYRYADDVLYCTVYNGRSDSRMERVVSMLVKTFPVRCDVSGGRRVADYLSEVSEHMMGAMENDLCSFADISREWGVKADVMFTYQGDLFAFDRLCGIKCTVGDMVLDTAKAAIDIDAVLKGDKLELQCSYGMDSYDEAFMRGFAESIMQAAFSLTSAEYVRDVRVMTDKAEKQIHSFNDTDYPVAAESVNRMFERQAELHPDRTAVIAADEELTYGELENLANRTANSLINEGAKDNEIVGLLCGRTKEAFIGELAILKSGCAFLPMVPEYPDERIDFCLKDAGSHYVLTTEAILREKAELFKDKPYKAVTFEELLKNEDGTRPNLEISPDALAYCIYTSGSTGTPKGVMIEHRNLRNFLDANAKNPETENYVKHGHTVLSVISISFDFSLMETQLPLCNGLTVCMASEDEIHNPMALADKMIKYGADVMSCTPSLITNMIEIPQIQKALAGMKLYDFGAESFPSALFEKLSKVSPDAVICNGYGPTETTISCISKRITDADSITIGKPAANVKAYVCDKNLNLLPAGACGELVIGGAGVGRGYVGLPEKTAAAFVMLNGERAYRSGDVVRFLDNGEIEFFGRLDNQVKLRGFRVELDEIENNINTFPGVRSSKIIVRNNGSEDYLAAFFTADYKIELSELTAHLKEKLTYYMVPSVMMQLDEMPLTVNGKIDKKKLPEVEYSVTRNYVEPEEGLEAQICRIYADTLKQDKVGAEDDFFEIGGTSLSAAIVVFALNNQGINVVYQNIFDNPSPRELTKFIRSSTKQNNYFSDDYDYSKIDKLLEAETLENVDNFRGKELGNIILTGATGFLGIHILKEYLDNYDGTAYCLMRKGNYRSCEQRLKNMLMYYHSKTMGEYFGTRIICIEGDVTDPEQLKQLDSLDAGIVINCAALVKHFVSDDSLDRINVGGVKNLTEMCLRSHKRLVQISTTSVGGYVNKGEVGRIIHENELQMGQIINNDYIRTKFLAERTVLEAKAEKGLDGMIIRVGNLMSRSKDGEFQINFITNNFMRSLKAYKQLKAFPVTMMHEEAEFSPIDSTAAAILELAGTESGFSIYHAYNNHMIYMADVIAAMREYGFRTDIVSEEKFGEIMKAASADPKFSEAMLSLIAYQSGDDEVLYPVGSDNLFTSEVLYRKGYLWPIIDSRYLANVINVLDGFEFFEAD